MKRSLARLSIPFREPFATAGGVATTRELLLLRVTDDAGVTGCGEAAPFEPYDGVPLERVAAALLDGAGADGPPQARAAEEMAALDLEARRLGRPVGEPGASAIAVNRTLPAGPPSEVSAAAIDAVRTGFSCLKLKVGLYDDEERVGAVRAAVGPWPALRLDANGAWSAEEATARVQSLARYDLELVEQPCAGLAELAEVRSSVEVPIAADESVSTPADVLAAAELRACDVVNVKLASSGGFRAARELLHCARENGLGAYLSSTLDGPWGIAAALQLAATEELTLACGLATLELFEGPLARALPPARNGLMAVPDGPGLGVAVEDSALADALVEELA